MPDLAFGRTLACALALALAAPAAAQTMYKWVDEKGVTHFSESPPPEGAKGEKFQPRVTPPSSTVAPRDEAEKWRNQEAEFKKRQIARGQKEEAEARQAQQRQAKCDEARRKLAWYSDGRIFRDNPDGTRTWMTEANRDAILAQQRDAVREYCN